jgi:hypothetical protein
MTNDPSTARSAEWPSLPLKEWETTRDTLHMWMQMAGKVRMTLTPKVNHCWEVPFYVAARGLTTSPIPYEKGIFEMLFDFIDHSLIIETSSNERKTLRLEPRTVADFYAEFRSALHSLGIEVKIWPMPVEIPNPIRFDQDRQHASYDRDYARRFWQVLVSADSVMKEFRARFTGKASPVHFFWGAMDLAVTRFSGRRASERPGADRWTREAYSHEVISAGFWPGSGDADAVFYSYAAPEPAGFSAFSIHPREAYYSSQFSEFFLPYDVLRSAPSPRKLLLEFFQSVYEAGATLGKWDREALERLPVTNTL